MAARKDVLMMQVVSAFSQGYGGAELTDEASSWFYDRYYAWLDTPKNNPSAGGLRPMDVWDQNRGNFLERFRQIGQKSVDGGTVTADSVQSGALAIEQTSDCPWCPIQP